MEFSTFLSQYYSGTVVLSPGVSYELLDVVNDNYRRFNRRFENPYFADGTEKIYYPLSYIMARTLFENTDIDTKDINLHSETFEYSDVVALLKPTIRQHLKDTDFGETLNHIRQELINMGHVIVKEVDGESKIVDLRNIVRPPHMMDIQDGSVGERILMTYEDLLSHKEDWEDHWDEIEEMYAIMSGNFTTETEDGEDYKKTVVRSNVTGKTYDSSAIFGEETTYFVTYEYWTRDIFKVKGKDVLTKGCIRYLDRSILHPTDDGDAPGWTPTIELERFASPFTERVTSVRKRKALKKEGQLVGEDEVRIYPYEEQRLITIPGRWMGVGIYEITAGPEKQFNEILNNKRRMDSLMHRGVYLHRLPSNGESSGLTQEFINSLTTGAVLTVEQDEDFQRLNMGTMIQDFILSADKVFELARQISGVTASGTGEELPASTTATMGVINQQKAKTTFDVIVEQQSLFLRRLFTRFKLKSIIEELSLGEWINIVGDPMELNTIEDVYVKNYVYSKIDEAMKSGKIVMPGDVEKLVEAVKAERERRGFRPVQFSKEILKNIRMKVEFVITNESFDKLNRIRELQQAIQNAIMDPNNTLSITRMQEEVLDLLNLSGRKYRMTEEELAKVKEGQIQAAMLDQKETGSMKSSPTVLSPGQDFGNTNASA